VVGSFVEGDVAIGDGLFKDDVDSSNDIDVFGDLFEVDDQIAIEGDAIVGFDVSGKGNNAPAGSVEVFAIAVGGIDAPFADAVRGHVGDVDVKVARDGENGDLFGDEVYAKETDGIGLLILIDAKHEDMHDWDTAADRLGLAKSFGGGCGDGR